jgi:polyisoprenoid-binding protein YceI
MIGWICGILGVALLFSPGPAKAVERYIIVTLRSQFQFRTYSLLAQPLGTFHTFSGDVWLDVQHPFASRVHFVVQAASIDTGNVRRDNHLRSPDFLFVEQFPTITFVSTAIAQHSVNDYAVQGDLQIRGVTKRLTIPVTVAVRPSEVIFRGSVRLDRREFGVYYNAFFNPIRDAIDVMFTIIAMRP